MKGALKIGTVRGIGVFIHWTFFLLLGWVAYSEFAESSSVESVGNELLMVLLVFTCVLLHEFGHALMAQRYQVRTRDITLLPLGGVARLERMPEKPVQELLVALAGPLVNLIIIVLLLPFILFGKGWPMAVDLEFVETNGLLVNLMMVNISLLVFNLLPAFPMDGGRVLRSVLAMKLKRELATRIAAYIGMAIAVVFVIVGFYVNPILALIGLFVFFGAGSELKTMKAIKKNDAFSLDIIVRKAFVSGDIESTIQEAIQRLNASASEFMVLQNGVGGYAVLSAEELYSSYWAMGGQIHLSELPIAYAEGLSIETPLEDAANQMVLRDLTAMAVIQNDTITGVVTVRDVSILLRMAVRSNLS